MREHQIALWAGVAAFFGSLLAVGAIDLLTPESRYQFLGSIIVAIITGGSVYSKQRYDDAKSQGGEVK